MLASETATDVSAPNHAIGEEQRFKTDFYSYLDSPENASRYTIGIDALARMFPAGDIRMVDLGCGYASIAKYLPSRFRYTGVDHSSAAISECAERFPNFEFVQSDAITYLNAGLSPSQPIDVFVLCGFLFHNVDKDTLAKHDDQQLVSRCLDKIAKDGVLLIIAPFAFSEKAGFRMLEQANWKLDCVRAVLDGCAVEIAWQSMAVQIGAGARARAQSMVPDWWVPADRDGNTNRYSGTELGSWTLLVKRA